MIVVHSLSELLVAGFVTVTGRSSEGRTRYCSLTEVFRLEISSDCDYGEVERIHLLGRTCILHIIYCTILLYDIL